jgi:hypothetical protein
VAATGIVAALSFVWAPGAWAEWLAFVVRTWNVPAPVPVLAIPLVVRVPVAVALIGWGARTDRRWTVPLGVALSSPLPYAGWLVTMAMGALFLWHRDGRSAGGPDPAAR